MGLLSNLLGRRESDAAPSEPASETCPHLALTPRWDNIDDMGHDDLRILRSRFQC